MDDIKKPLPKKVAGARKPELDARLRMAGSKPTYQSMKAPALRSLDGTLPAVKSLQRPQPVAATPAPRPPRTKLLRRSFGNLRRFIPTRLLTRITRSLRELWRNVPFTRRFQLTYTLILLTALLTIPLGLAISHHLTNQRYLLSTATKQLIGSPAPGLDSKLSYNKQAGAFQFNPNARKGLTGPSGADGDNGVKIGGQQYYGVNLAKAVSKGQTFTDTTTKLSFTIAPAFKALGGKHTDGHVVYPFSKGQVVYTLKDNGLREDVVLPKPVTNLSLDYKLTLPDTLTARVEPNGALAIYSADPALFGNISYGGSSDQAAVQKARTTAKKTNLVFLLPAPVIAASKGTTTSAHAHFSLKGNTLTILADGLKQLHYPISIDPSVVVQSANSFTNGNNEDGNASIATSSVTRSGIIGGILNNLSTDTTCGTTGTWCNVNTGASGINSGGTGGGGTSQSPTLAYNGYLYSIGGEYNQGGNDINTVSYASINSSNGSLGAWNTGSTLYGGTAISVFGSTTYNGYLYVIGGENQGGTGQTVIQYALICTGNNAGQGGCTSTPGSVGTWTASTTSTNFFTVDSVPTRAIFGMVAYNGYMYAMGGYRPDNNSFVGDALYAPIRANGDLGNWSTTMSMPYAGSTIATAYNGHIYVGVSCATTSVLPGGCTATANLLIGNISSTGAISSWTTSSTTYTAFGNRDSYAGITAANGYLYVAGGGNGGAFAATVNYSQIYASGNVGPALTTSSLPTAEWSAGLAAYNGYLYVVGGYYSSSPGAGSLTSTAYAKIDAVGNTGSYASTGTGANSAGAGVYDTSANARSWPSVLAYGGYMYIIGGYQATGGTAVSSILYAPINTDGSIGTWQATTKSLNVARSGAGAVVANGYLYVTGGNSNNGSGGYLNDTEWAPIGASGNITTAFTDDTTHVFTTARQYLGAATYNGYLYIVGGRYSNNTVSLGDLQYVPLNASTGALSSNWTATTKSLPTLEALPAVTTSGGYIYVIGGNQGSTADSTVYYSKFDSTGDITTTFGSAPTLPSGRYGAGASASNGFIYVASGNGGGSLTDSLYAAICTGSNTTTQFTTNCNGSSTPGTTSSWNSGPTLSNVGYGLTVTTYNGYIYTIGGCVSQGVLTFACSSSANTYNQVQYAPLNNGGGGAATSWTSSTNNIINARETLVSVAYKGYLYILGGDNGSTTAYNDVQYAPINSDGTIGAWHYTHNSTDDGTTFVAGFTGARRMLGVIVYNGYMYVLGGLTIGATEYGDVQYAPINANGTIGTWNYTHNSTNDGATFVAGLNTARNSFGFTAYNGYMYVTGGCSNNGALFNGCQTWQNDVQYAPINSDGTIGAWHYTHNSTDDGTTFVAGFTTARAGLSTLAANGYLYILGGGQVGSFVQNDVQYAPINANGTVGTWSTTNSFNVPRQNQKAVISNGYMYIVGGGGLNNGAMSDVQYAPIYSNGTLGAWSGTTNFTTARYAQGTAIYNGFLYLTAGTNNSSYYADTQYAPLQSQPRIAHYSYLTDLKSTSNGTVGGDPQITRMGVGYTTAAASSTVTACLQGATTAAPSNNNSFGSATCFTNPGSKTPQTWKNYGRYAFVYVTLDDSQSATYPDATQSSLTELDTYFHAAPARRLRMGQTFTDMGNSAGTNNQLDVEGP